VHEFVAMPDHFQLLITIRCEMTVERAIQYIKGGLAYRAASKTADLAKGIFRNAGDGSSYLREAAGVPTKQSRSWFPGSARGGLSGIVRLSGFWAGYATAAADGILDLRQLLRRSA
jgi:hypothetical protein